MMRALSPLLCVFLWFSAQAVEVYKDADERGPARYSDMPFPGSEVYEVPPLPTYTPPKRAGLTTDSTESEADRDYKALSITNIQDGEAVRANDGNVTVKLAAKPGLKAAAGHRFMVLLDGEERQRSNTPTVGSSSAPRRLPFMSSAYPCCYHSAEPAQLAFGTITYRSPNMFTANGTVVMPFSCLASEAVLSPLKFENMDRGAPLEDGLIMCSQQTK